MTFLILAVLFLLMCLSGYFLYWLGKRAGAGVREKLEAVREQAAYGFTGETLENMTEGMSAQEMNGWWMRRLDAILGGQK